MAGNYAEVIRKGRAAQGMNQQELAERLGVSRNTVAGWETGHSRPDLDTVPAICRTLRIPLSQFFGLKGTVSLAEKQFLETFRSLEEGDREVVLWQMEALVQKRREQLLQEASEKIISVYASDLGAAAGFGGTLDGARGEKIFLRKDPLTEKADEVIRVSGRSMEPTYHDGDQVLVRHTDRLRDGEIGIFLVDGEGFIKEYREDGLHSHNRNYATMKFTEYSDVRCVGQVIGRLTEDLIPSEKEIQLAQEARRGRKGAHV